MKKIILDMSTCTIFANASKFVEIINAYSNENYKIEIIKKNWSDINFRGMKFDKDKKMFSKPDGNYLWDPKTHPDDYFDNLVFSSFKNLVFLKKPSLLKKLILFISPAYITYNLCLEFTSNQQEKKRTQKYYLLFLFKNFSIKNLISYVLKIFETKVLIWVKNKPKQFSSFKYVLSERKMS